MKRRQAWGYFLENRLWDLQRHRKRLYICGIVLAGVLVAAVLLFQLIVPSIRYSQAKNKLENGDYAGAVRIFKDLGSFRDSDTYASQYSLLAVEPGDLVQFGSFEQDGNLENGPEPIEWIALKTEGNHVYLLSKYLLKNMSYSAVFGIATWDTSGIREWLNGEFYNKAFTDDERSAIMLTHNDASVNERYPDMPAGEDTDDYLFLLSLYEVKEFFPDDNDKYATATEYAVQNGARVLPETGYSWWWTRTVGANRTLSTAVHGQYQVVFDVADFYGCNVNNSEGCVRPAMWVDANAYAKLITPQNEE